jgi:hypothetical protein
VQLFREGGRKKGSAPPDDTYRMYHDFNIMTITVKTIDKIDFISNILDKLSSLQQPWAYGVNVQLRHKQEKYNLWSRMSAHVQGYPISTSEIIGTESSLASFESKNGCEIFD